MRLREVKPNKSFLYESMLHKNELSSLTHDQRIVMEQVEETLLPYINQYKSILLTEAPISASEVGNVFQQAADLHKSTPAGKGILQKSATAIGQSLPVTVVRKANAALDELGKKIQDTEPVQNFDAAVSRQIQEIKTKLQASEAGAEIVKAVQKYAAFGKENPGKQAIILSVVVLAASFAAGPLGGALAGFIMRAGNDLIAGKKASSAIGGAAKAAAIGALVGFAARWIGDTIIGNIEMAGIEDIEAMSTSLDQAAVDNAMAGVTDQYGNLVSELDGAMTIQLNGNINAFNYSYDVIMPPDAYQAYEAASAAVDAAGKTFSPEWYTEVAKFHDFMAGLQADPDQSGLRAALAAVKEAQKATMSYADMEGIIGQYSNLEGLVDNLSTGNEVIAAAAQAGAQQADQLKAAATSADEPTEPEKPVPADMIPPEAKTTESIDEDAELYEFDFASLKKMAGTAAKGAMNAVKDIGTVSAKDLMNAWKKSGSPEDTDSIRNILVGKGMSPDVIDTAFSTAGVEAPATDAEAPAGGEAPTTTGTIPADISMMDLSAMILDAGLIEIPSGKRLNPTLAKILPEEDTKENEMRVDEMCGCGGEEMEAPKTNYNLNVTKDEGNTHKTMTVTSDQPDELIRILQLSGMDTGHSVPDSIDMDHHDSSPDMDHHDSSPVSSMKDLVAKISGPSIDDGSDKDTHEDVEMDITSKPATFGLKDLVVGQTKKQPRQRRVAARQGDNPYKDAGQLEEEFTAEYEKFKNIE